MAKALAFVVLLLVSPAAYAAEHKVGDTSGWTSSGVNYTTWAAGQSFVVGDTLLFNYGAPHGLDEVNEADFTSCTSTSPLDSHPNGPTTITLNATGTRYFLCPTPGHCSNGQKLSVTVSSSGSPTGSAPATPSGTTPATPGTHSSPPPPSSAAALVGGDSLMVGLMSLVLMALVGLIMS